MCERNRQRSCRSRGKRSVWFHKLPREVLDEETLTTDLLISTVKDMYANKEKYIDAMKSSNMTDAVSTIVNLIEETVN